VNFAFSEEQEELRRAVRQFLESKSPETEVRRLSTPHSLSKTAGLPRSEEKDNSRFRRAPLVWI